MKNIKRPERMTYPDYTIAPVVDTIFIEGFKFEICEFEKQARKEFSVRDSSRYFLFFEDSLFQENLYLPMISVFGAKEIWGNAICKDKAFLKSTIASFENKISMLKKYYEKNANGAKFYTADLEKEIFTKFGVQLKTLFIVTEHKKIMNK